MHSARRSTELRIGRFWAHKRTVRYFGWAYVQTRFQGMWLGWLWLPLRPSLQMLSKGFVFGGMLQVGSGDRPYIIFLMVGQAAWDFFDKIVYQAFRGLKAQRRTLAAFPLPWATVIASTVWYAAFDALTYVAIGGIASIYYKVTQGRFYIDFTLPGLASFSVGVALLAGWGIGAALITAPVIIRIPDLRFVIRYGLGFWYFVTPVLYATSSLPGSYRKFALYNPISAPVEFVKDGLLGTGPPPATSTIVSLIGLAVVIPLGLVSVGFFERQAHARF